MESRQLQHVTLEQAKRLKKAGFGWECDYFYLTRMYGAKTVENELCTYGQSWNYNEYAGKYFSAPTVALVLKWLRDVKKSYVVMIHYDTTGEFFMSGKLNEVEFGLPDYDTYEAAESALLDELLTILEEEK